MNLGKLRAIAKRVKTNQELAIELWSTDVTPARLLALLICRPKAFEGGRARPDAARVASTQGARLARQLRREEELPRRAVAARVELDDPDALMSPPPGLGAHHGAGPEVARDGIDLEGFLDEIESDAHEDGTRPLQWSMNRTLAEIGIRNPALRPRAIDIGERLEVVEGLPPPRPAASRPCAADLDQRDVEARGRVTFRTSSA